MNVEVLQLKELSRALVSVLRYNPEVWAGAGHIRPWSSWWEWCSAQVVVRHILIRSRRKTAWQQRGCDVCDVSKGKIKRLVCRSGHERQSQECLLKSASENWLFYEDSDIFYVLAHSLKYIFFISASHPASSPQLGGNVSMCEDRVTWTQNKYRKLSNLDGKIIYLHTCAEQLPSVYLLLFFVSYNQQYMML